MKRKIRENEITLKHLDKGEINWNEPRVQNDKWIRTPFFLCIWNAFWYFFSPVVVAAMLELVTFISIWVFRLIQDPKEKIAMKNSENKRKYKRKKNCINGWKDDEHIYDVWCQMNGHVQLSFFFSLFQYCCNSTRNTSKKMFLTLFIFIFLFFRIECQDFVSNK